MAGDKKSRITIIRKKKIVAAHGGGHGGAWKVAYADFVTAMMCFFLVMWLLGADEEIKAAVADYFKKQNIPWQVKKDAASNEAYPMGERKSYGDSLLHGLNGGIPPDMVTAPPTRTISEVVQSSEEISDFAQEILEGQAYGIDVEPDFVKFSVQEELLFEPGGVKLTARGSKYLDRLGRMFRAYSGNITIKGHTDQTPQDIGTYQTPYEFSLVRSTNIKQYFVENRWVQEDKITPVGKGSSQAFAPNEIVEGRKRNRRIEFVLTLSDRS